MEKAVEVPQDRKEEPEKEDEIIPNRNDGTEEKTNMIEDSEVFDSFSGCAVLFDSENQTYTFYNEKMCNEEVSPCSTFKIVSTLMGLHNQVIESEESKLGSDCNPYPELNGFWLDSSLKISPLEQVDNLRTILEGKTIYTEKEITV